MAGRAYYKFQNVNSFPNLEEFLTGNKELVGSSTTTPTTVPPKRVILDIKGSAPKAVQDQIDNDPKKQQPSTMLAMIWTKLTLVLMIAASSCLVIGGWVQFQQHGKSGLGNCSNEYTRVECSRS